MTSNEMSARLSSSRKPKTATYLLREGALFKSAHDSLYKPDGKTKNVTAARARSIGELLTGHDLEVLNLLSTVHLATGQQIRRLLWGEDQSAARQARRQLAKLADLRVVTRIDRRVGGVRSGSEGYAYVLDVVGRFLTSPGGRRKRQPRAPGLAFVGHGVALAECYLKLRQLDHQRKAILVHFESEPHCWRSFYGLGGARKILKPDAFAITGTHEFEDRWFLEIDRATESPGRLKTKAEAYINYWQSGREQAESDLFPLVLFVVPDEKRRNQVVDLFAKLPAEHWQLFAVCTDAGFGQMIELGAARGGNEEVSHE